MRVQVSLKLTGPSLQDSRMKKVLCRRHLVGGVGGLEDEAEGAVLGVDEGLDPLTVRNELLRQML